MFKRLRKTAREQKSEVNNDEEEINKAIEESLSPQNRFGETLSLIEVAERGLDKHFIPVDYEKEEGKLSSP